MDNWTVLGLAPGVSRKEIRSAFLRLARQLHPDRNPAAGAHERFVEVRRAYEALIGHGRSGAAPTRPQPGPPPPQVTPADIIAAARAAFRRELQHQGMRVTSDGMTIDVGGMRIVMTIG